MALFLSSPHCACPPPTRNNILDPICESKYSEMFPYISQSKEFKFHFGKKKEKRKQDSRSCRRDKAIVCHEAMPWNEILKVKCLTQNLGFLPELRQTEGSGMKTYIQQWIHDDDLSESKIK